MTRRLMRHALMAVAAALMLALGSCHSSRQASRRPAGPEAPQWHDMKVPVSVRLTQPASMRLNGTMTMVRDRSIAVSLRMLGFEVAALYATPDSVFAYARMQKTYVAESLGRALGLAGATLGDLQALLTGAPMTLPRPEGSVRVSDRTDPATGQLLEVSVEVPGGRSVELTYTPQQGLPLAEAVELVTRAGGRELGAAIEYDWQRAEADRGVEPKGVTIPRGYRRIEASALLKALGRQE